jgi:hypothetical protein
MLERFRRSAGVPAGVGDELAAELSPVFAALDEIEREVSRLRDRSEASAAVRLQEAENEVERILAEGHRSGAQQRHAELRSAVRRADAEAEEIAGQAEVEAQATRRLGRERLPRLVDEVLARVLEAEA